MSGIFTYIYDISPLKTTKCRSIYTIHGAFRDGVGVFKTHQPEEIGPGPRTPRTSRGLYVEPQRSEEKMCFVNGDLGGKDVWP